MPKNLYPLIILAVFAFSCSKNDVLDPNTETETEIVPIAKCENGFAGEYPCKDYDLLTYISLENLAATSTRGNDCWGWVDASTEKEYALVGTNTGTTFIDITDPANAVILGTLATSTVSSGWRDIKVYNNHAFIVSEASDHGMQVFNLTRLRDIITTQDLTADATYTGFGSAHNIVINEDKGYAYPVGTSRSGAYAGGPLFINIQDPINPINEGGFPDYAHDAQVVTYSGPDIDHTGKEILIGSNETEVIIVDVTDKTNPQEIASIDYSNIGYTHQGWFTEDFKYFILGDELDERNFGGNTRTVIFDFTDLDNPVFHTDYFGGTAAIDHNGYVKGNTYFQANYTAGVRMIDISNIGNKLLTEVGFFDTYPEDNSTIFKGAWNVYPYFPSGNIIISDINRGFFVIRKSGT